MLLNKKRIIAILILAFAAVGVFGAHDVQARTATEVYSSIMDKAVFQGVYKCYTNEYIVRDINPLSEYVGISSLLTDYKQQDENFVPLVSGVNSSSVWSTNRYQVKDDGLSCKQLFEGGSYSFGGSNSSLLKALNKPAPDRNNTDSVKSFVENMGYNVTSLGDDSCYSLPFSLTAQSTGIKSEYVTNAICRNSVDGTLYENGANDVANSAKFGIVDGKLCLSLLGNMGLLSRVGECYSYGGQTWSGELLIATVKNACGSMTCSSSTGSIKDGGDRYEYVFDSAIGNILEQGSLQNLKAEIAGNNFSNAALKAIRYLSDNNKYNNVSDVKVDDIEKRLLYQTYFTSFYGAEVNCGEGLSDAGFDGTVNWYDSGMKVCHYSEKNLKNKDEAVNGIVNGFFSYGSIANYDALKAELAALRTEYAEEEIEKAEEIINGPIEGQQGEDSSVCYEKSGAIGWILCPVIAATSGIGNSMWTNIIEKNLQVQANGIFNSSDGLRAAWGRVRDIGNVAFIIMFLLVIFSQLTGYGIDNYGIKKILPRLIVVAIVMNLSFIVCELAVDVSNILGSGLKSVFDEAAKAVGYGQGSSTSSMILAGAGTTLLGAGGIAVFTLLNPLGGLGAAATIGLAALGLVITIVVSILVLYLILIIREAGVILCVVLAPVAIICYALPNTEKLYKRWFDIFKALLVVYPICGMVVGAGKFAGAILSSAADKLGKQEGASLGIAAMLVQVLPFFLIPMLLKNSLSLLGNIGTKVSNMGRNISRRSSGAVQGAIKNSEKFKDWSQFQKDRTTAARAGRIQKRLENIGKSRALTAREQDRLTKARQAVLAQRTRTKNADLGASELGWAMAEQHQAAAFSNEREKMYAENYKYETNRDVIDQDFAEALTGTDAERASAAMKELVARGGITEALNRVEAADWENMDDGVRRRVIQAMGESNIDAFKAFSKYRNSGGTHSFKSWLNGEAVGEKVRNADGTMRAVKDSSYAAHLHDNGYGAMNGYSKDEMQFVQRNFKSISKGMAEGELAGMLGVTAISSKDAKAQTIAEQTITEQLGNGSMTVADMGLTADMIGNMRGATMQSIMEGYMQNELRTSQEAGVVLSPEMARERAEKRLRSELSGQIAAIESDARINNRTQNSVKSILGIGSNAINRESTQAAQTGAPSQTSEAGGIIAEGTEVLFREGRTSGEFSLPDRGQGPRQRASQATQRPDLGQRSGQTPPRPDNGGGIL